MQDPFLPTFSLRFVQNTEFHSFPIDYPTEKNTKYDHMQYLRRNGL